MNAVSWWGEPNDELGAAWDGLEVGFVPINGTTVIWARGEVDTLTVRKLANALDKHLNSGVQAVVLDLQNVTFFGCAGVAMLLDIMAAASARRIAFSVLPNPLILRTMASLGLTSRLGFSGSVGDISAS